MSMTVPRPIGTVTVNWPSVSARTRPVTVSGSPVRPMLGMSVLPPSGSVTVLPTPAAVIVCTADGSQIANMATSASPWRRTSASTAVVSWVPPEAELSAWSSRITGPSLIAFARATESASGSAPNTKRSRSSHASASSASQPASARARSPSATVTTDSPASRMSASGKPPNTDAASSPSPSSRRACSISGPMGRSS